MSDMRATQQARLERLILATNDMGDVAAAARFLRTEEFVLPPVRRALLTGMFTSYARAFNTSKGDPPLPAAPTSGLSPADRATHEWALGERDMVWAHVDRDGRRRKTSVQQPSGFLEEWTPPTPEELAALEALADKLGDRYIAEATELRRELQA